MNRMLAMLILFGILAAEVVGVTSWISGPTRADDDAALDQPAATVVAELK